MPVPQRGFDLDVELVVPIGGAQARQRHAPVLPTTERVADAVLEGRLPGHGLRKIDLADDYEPALEIATGIFARKGERDRYAADHPLNLPWKAFAEASPTRSIPAVLPG
ncbi:MAG: hypothetical protein ACRDTG_13495 [Pseudonocardiaceae bacterium]